MPNERPAQERDDDRAYMRRALDLAQRGWGQTAPNPMVGAVVVRDGTIVGEGYHARYGEAHAEVAALRAAGELARGSTVYITLEPCAHHGKTPPCVDALIAAGVARVVIAARDPNPDASGGLDRLSAAGIQVATGIEESQARELNAPFFHAFASRRPWVMLKLAVSIDAAIADAAGRSQWITGPRSRRVVHHLRAGSDAVAVGLGTLLADDPSLTVRDAPAPRTPPRRVIFDRHARTPLDARVVRTARDVPTIIVAESPDPARARALEGAGIQIVSAPTVEAALEQLAREGVRSLLVEGGARLAGTLLEHALVHRLIIFQAPVLLGAGALGAFAFAPAMPVGDAPHLRVLERRTLGADTMTVYALPGS
jgi:diaminohydroxyphosphoribosylaminopyrimidine deaminase/5-amino-6-(5-phosphoribosylamino)uracil reductase